MRDFASSQEDAEYESLLKAIDSRASKDLVAAKPSLPENPAIQYRRDVRNIVQRIVQPEDLNWMDDDEGITDEQFAERAVGDIRHRFERCVRLGDLLSICTHLPVS